MATTGTIKTKYGPAKFTWTEAGHVYLEGSQWVINSVLYSSANFHLYKLPDGTWSHICPNDRGRYGPYLHRRDMKEPTEAAKKAALSAAVPAWTEYAAAHPEDEKQAEREKLAAALERAKGKRDEAQKELEKAEQEVGEAEKALAELG